MLDDYGDLYKDQHPYKGYVITIGSGKESRGKGITDQLIKEAIKNNPDERLLAEIDIENFYSRNLFVRNGFKPLGFFDGIMVYSNKIWFANLSFLIIERSDDEWLIL